MTRAEYNAYKKKWKKRHPHYDRDLMRLKRGATPGGPNLKGYRYPLGSRLILGVPVLLDRWRLP